MFGVSGASNIRRLEGFMLDDNWASLSDTFPLLEYREDIQDDPMVYTRRQGRPLYNHSFVAQMGSILRSIREQSGSAAKVGYFLTANSALPLIHTVRGMYNSLPQEQPVVSPIRTYARPSIDEDPAPSAATTAHRIRRETARVAKLIKLQRLNTAVVIDQFVASGTTLQFAMDMVHRAGIERENIYPVAGRWYHDFTWNQRTEQATDILHVDPADDPFCARLYMIGSLAAQQMLEDA